ncbi:MAG: aminotransferase class I/II-fold pyridoxal phosphate-dependent enzyme, partial [Dehalococcoidia bacterium]
YENYGPDTLLAGGRPVYVSLQRVGDSFQFDPAELRQAFSSKTKAIVVNTPHNPTGTVYSREELQLIADLCTEHNALALADEPYEHILFDGATHLSIAAMPGMERRTVTLNSVSKTYSVTGWRIGWAIALDEAISDSIRRAHDFLTVGAAAPLQEAVVEGLKFPRSYYDELARDYQARRDLTLAILREAGFDYVPPQGAYYVMTGYPDCGYDDDMSFSYFMAESIGVTTVPGRAFCHGPELGKGFIRFSFPKKLETLQKVRERLSRLGEFVR